MSKNPQLMHEPRITFQSRVHDTMSKCQYKGKAALTVHYHTDGTGRDSYINRDNGGFNKMYNPIKWPNVGSFVPKRVPTENKPLMHPMPVYYHSNGSGRDSYIVETGGGLHNLSRMIEYREAFVKSLRSYSRPKSAYIKQGGRQVGFQRTPSVNTGKRLPSGIAPPSSSFIVEPIITDQAQMAISDSPPKLFQSSSPLKNSNNLVAHQNQPKRDILVESQLHYDSRFFQAQQQLKLMQKSLDGRLSAPKHLRQRAQVNDYIGENYYSNSAVNKSIVLRSASQLK